MPFGGEECPPPFASQFGRTWLDEVNEPGYGRAASDADRAHVLDSFRTLPSGQRGYNLTSNDEVNQHIRMEPRADGQRSRS